jgi:hypothetical protein
VSRLKWRVDLKRKGGDKVDTFEERCKELEAKLTQAEVTIFMQRLEIEKLRKIVDFLNERWDLEVE